MLFRASDAGDLEDVADLHCVPSTYTTPLANRLGHRRLRKGVPW